MLKQKYFLTGIFILSAERQPIKLAWRKIVWLQGYSVNNSESYLLSAFLRAVNVKIMEIPLKRKIVSYNYLSFLGTLHNIV